MTDAADFAAGLIYEMLGSPKKVEPPKDDPPRKTIWKYQLELKDDQLIEMPVSSEFLSVGIQAGVICLWVLVNPTYPLVSKTILIRGTGHDIGTCFKKSEFIGTVQQGPFVWHIFDGSPAY